MANIREEDFKAWAARQDPVDLVGWSFIGGVLVGIVVTSIVSVTGGMF